MVSEKLTGWQPIETAPKDGTVILLAWQWEEGDGELEVITTGWEIVTGQWGTPTIFGQTGDWWADNGAASCRLAEKPTHWMYPPAPPGAPRAPADLRSALEAETIERCAKYHDDEAAKWVKAATKHKRLGGRYSDHEDRDLGRAADHRRHATAIRALAPTKEPAA